MSADLWCAAPNRHFAICLRPITLQQRPVADQGCGICGAFRSSRWGRSGQCRRDRRSGAATDPTPTAETHTGGDDAVDLRQGNLWLGPRCAVLDWNARTLQTHRITRPTLGNEET